MDERKINPSCGVPSLLSAEDLRSFGTTLIVAPHPDDESLGCGGVIALLRQSRIEVTIAVMSDGTLSHPNSKTFPANRLRELRETELAEAAQILGVERDGIIFFRYPDRGVPDKTQPSFGVAAEQMRRLIVDRGIETIFVPWRRDPHPDHRAAYDIVAASMDGGIRVIEYPIWMDHLASPDDLPTANEVSVLRVDISSVLEIKRRAVMAHRSQTSDLINDDPDGFRLEADILEGFITSSESYFEAK